MRNKKIIFLYLFIVICSLCSFSFAHSGGTDKDGGHFVGNTGEYHYHHGYPAHQHPNGICPYAGQKNKSINKSNELSDSSVNIGAGLIILSVFFIPRILVFIADIGNRKEKKSTPSKSNNGNGNDKKSLLTAGNSNNIIKREDIYKSDTYICPNCGGKLKLRYGRYGYFLGCSNFPRCRYTRDYRSDK